MHVSGGRIGFVDIASYIIKTTRETVSMQYIFQKFFPVRGRPLSDQIFTCTHLPERDFYNALLIFLATKYTCNMKTRHCYLD